MFVVLHFSWSCFVVCVYLVDYKKAGTGLICRHVQLYRFLDRILLWILEEQHGLQYFIDKYNESNEDCLSSPTQNLITNTLPFIPHDGEWDVFDDYVIPYDFIIISAFLLDIQNVTEEDLNNMREISNRPNYKFKTIMPLLDDNIIFDVARIEDTNNNTPKIILGNDFHDNLKLYLDECTKVVENVADNDLRDILERLLSRC